MEQNRFPYNESWEQVTFEEPKKYITSFPLVEVFEKTNTHREYL